MFRLTEIEKQSSLWKRIEEELSGRLSVLRQQNDGDRTDRETATLRGQIKEIKICLSWANTDPQIKE